MTTIHLQNDWAGTTETYETDRDATDVIKDAMTMVRATNKRTALYRLCVHLTDGVVKLHWFSTDDKLANSVDWAAKTIERATEGILTGRVQV